ncbi:diguanylate cyclase [Acetobacter senegalensis DSM 18889]|nr:diguanylate cyclase [Acetobacter senegalensis DSM 18889]
MKTIEWEDLVKNVPSQTLKILHETVSKRHNELAETFYSVLRSYPDGARFLSDNIIETKLRSGLINWLKELFPADIPNIKSLVKMQIHIGDIHARLHIPVHIVLHGGRILRRTLQNYLSQAGLSDEDYMAASFYADDMIDIAIEFMSQAFVRNTIKAAETSEVFRHISLGREIGLERQMQRAVLFEWGQKLLFNIVSGTVTPLHEKLSSSPFGLWLRHKGEILFKKRPEMQNIIHLINRIDEHLVPKVLSSPHKDQKYLLALDTSLKEIIYLLDQLFNEAEVIESGRDPLTKLLTRRFLPTVLSREVAISLRRKIPFSIILIDVDHFKRINDTMGHPTGDKVLKDICEILSVSCRENDFLFRYGGEEFLLVLTETHEQEAWGIAERIRRTVNEKCHIIMEGQKKELSISCGIATFGGDPDYNRLIETADQALYIAKSNGRNQCHMAGNYD